MRQLLLICMTMVYCINEGSNSFGFRAKCLAILEEVQKTQETILVTKFGKPVAEVCSLPPIHRRGTWLGSMAGEIKFLGDVLAPVFDESDWNDSNELAQASGSSTSQS